MILKQVVTVRSARVPVPWPSRTFQTAAWVLLLLSVTPSPGATDRVFQDDVSRPSFGALRTFNFQQQNDHYILNGAELQPVTAEFVDLVTADQYYRVRATFGTTVVVSNGKPVESRHADVIRNWSKDIPRVAEILKQHDLIGSLKTVTYDLIEAKARSVLQLQEQLTLLWSADTTEAKHIGRTGLGPLMRFSEPVVDIQYRTPNGSQHRLLRKIFLQILYVRDRQYAMVLGSFLIVSRPDGDYEFYLVPRNILNQIVMGVK